jgi:hypothetical protein
MEKKEIKNLEDVVALAKKVGERIRVVRNPFCRKAKVMYAYGSLVHGFFICIPFRRPISKDELTTLALSVATKLWMESLIDGKPVRGGWKVRLPSGETYFIPT